MSQVYISWSEIYQKVDQIRKSYPMAKFYGVPRGGTIIAGLTRSAVDKPEDADIIIDDLIDSGATKNRYLDKYPQKLFLALYDKCTDPSLPWLIFPWEENETPASDGVIRILQAIGEDPNREGLRDTPNRYMKAMREFLSPPEFKLTTFEGENYDEMIVSSEIEFHSFCEHHMLPFFGVAAIGYIPGENHKIVGISKLPRTLEKFSRRLQNQERITYQVADFLMKELDAKGVGVILKARHFCQELRGVKKSGTQTTTSALRGVFKELEVREEFLKLIKL